METVDLEDLSLELLLITALHEEAERLASQLPEPSGSHIKLATALRRK
ncbi:hypothetical protein GCM10022226_73400 [Sphaerisporangium flaviroseum]|uniref:Uncharacterized protein n=1 Tax=Sphaerisporangium flaviroseum TaxID=509199 RepID=A0ABP7JBI4_9ACTN